ncbi:hypothetical protein DXG01_014936 [Tephrocybe rancida]|nr:hypothetical protein DXG01_014936 [Tephrocybe rancida]
MGHIVLDDNGIDEEDEASMDADVLPALHLADILVSLESMDDSEEIDDEEEGFEDDNLEDDPESDIGSIEDEGDEDGWESDDEAVVT